MGLKDLPDFQMTIEELYNKVEGLAEQKVELTMKILQIDAEIVMTSSIITVKAMKELGRI